MQMSDAVEIAAARTVSAANEYLAQDWKLLAVSTEGKGGSVHPCYILGRSNRPAGNLPPRSDEPRR